jgi:hypothetical protein
MQSCRQHCAIAGLTTYYLRQQAWAAVPFDRCSAYVGYWDGMDVERIIDEIEQLQEMFEAPDIRPLSASDISAANRRHDEMLAHSPWFRLWQRYGVCCRTESPISSIRRNRRLSLRTNSSTHLVDVAILKDRFGETSLIDRDSRRTRNAGRSVMAAVHPIEVLEKRLRDLLERYQSDLSHAVDPVTEKYRRGRSSD